jgi:hypothetical protein
MIEVIKGDENINKLLITVRFRGLTDFPLWQ